MLSTIDISRLTGVAKMTVYNWLRRNDIPTYPHGKRQYIHPLAVFTELSLTGLPLLPLKEAIAAVTDNERLMVKAFVLNARGQIPRLRFPGGREYHTTFGVAYALNLPHPIYLSIGEAAERLGVTPGTVARRIHRGSLSAVRKFGTNDYLVLTPQAMPVDTSGWVRSAEVAKQWNISQSAVHRLCRRGKLQAVRAYGGGGYYLIEPTQLPNPPRHPISTKQFAEITGIPMSTLENWRATGKIKGRRLGHVWRYPRSSALRIKRELQRA